MAFMEALVIDAQEGQDPSLKVKQISKPTPSEHQVLVKVQYAAQNPTDIQAFDNKVFGDGHVLGCDFVGIVEEIGPNVSLVSKGDTIAGLIWGGETKGQGAYAEYTIADERICFKVPSGTDPDAGATIPLAVLTAWLAFYSKDCLDIPKDDGAGKSVLVWGGSSSVGAFAIQIASLMGLEVITTCSPRHFDTVKSYGAKHVFDYHDDSVADQIKKAAPKLEYVFDTIGNASSSEIASKAISESGGSLCTVRPGKTYTEKVSKQTKVTDVLVWTAFLKDHSYRDLYWPANENDHRLSREFFEKVTDWLKEGKLRPNKTKVYEGGLDDVPKGFQEYRDGKISGYKIAYHV